MAKGSNLKLSGAADNGRLRVNDEDAWNLDDSDNDDALSSGLPSARTSISTVAQQAGLGRKGSIGTLSAGTANASSSSVKDNAAPNASLGQTSSSQRTTSAPHVATSSNAPARSLSPPLANKAATPANAFKERGRQTSFGFWERLSGLGAAVAGSGGSSSSPNNAGDDSLAETSGYTRFDDTVELEDNFDGTYSVSAATINRPPSTNGGQNRLLGPASIARQSAGTASGTRSGAIPRVPSSSALSIKTTSLTKGKGKLDSPSATIVGSPRPKSPTRKWQDGMHSEESMRKAVRSDLSSILEDPMHLMKNLSIATDAVETPQSSSSSHNPFDSANIPRVSMAATYDSPNEQSSVDPAASAVETEKRQAQMRREASKRRRFVDCLGKNTVDVSELRRLAWKGIPAELRAITWQLLLGYLPAPASRRVSVLARKRQEYSDAVRAAFGRGEAALDAQLWHQIQIDVPRTNPGVPLWGFASTQRSLERILYVWAIRHPASGYVQGINDLATPFFQVFLSSFIDCEVEDYDVSVLPEDALSALEGDTFWCLSKLLDGIQDNYIFAQPGIHRQVARCQELCMRVDAPLAKHMEAEGITFIQFSFRWFHLLFLRVLPVNAVIRMWDTYMSEGSDAFANFHTYVCLAFLLRFSKKLLAMDFQGCMLFLQDPIDHNAWQESDTEMLLSEAYMWSELWSGTKKPT